MLVIQEIIQIGVIKVVKTINNIEMPSTPSLNLIKLLIQDFSLRTEKSVLTSNEYHKNNDSEKLQCY